jgi:hypothetical protein
MNYRNKFYIVVRSPTSAGWDWVVDIDECTVRGGRAATEEGGIKAAKRRIDRVLAPQTFVRPSRDRRP